MKSVSYSQEVAPQGSTIVQVNSVSRWDVYYRLLQLDISCDCSTGNPLKVKVGSALDAIQVWSVTQQTIASRQSKIDLLKACWNY